MKNSVRVLSVALTAVAACSAGPALAAPAEAEATLDCGEVEYQIAGFGRGQVFHVVDSTTQFIVTQAQVVSKKDARIVFDNPGQAGRDDLVTCTTTSPNNTRYIFTGYFSPLG